MIQGLTGVSGAKLSIPPNGSSVQVWLLVFVEAIIVGAILDQMRSVVTEVSGVHGKVVESKYDAGKLTSLIDQQITRYLWFDRPRNL